MARVAATIIEGASSEEFARHAEQNLTYRLPNGTCLQVIGAHDSKVPIKELTNLKYSPVLFVVLPCNAVTLKTLSVLWLIDIARGYSAFGMNSVGYNFHIIIVGEVGKDSFTRQMKYGILRFPSATALVTDIDKQVGNENKEHLMQVWVSHQWDGSTGVDAARLCNEYIKGALKARLSRSPDAYISLSG